jgi:integrase/recombinase XerD
MPDSRLRCEICRTRKDYYFWSGYGKTKSCVGDYQRAFKTLYKLAEVENGHAHRWRDTFAVELLLKRVPIADVSVLLGHQSVKIT